MCSMYVPKLRIAHPHIGHQHSFPTSLLVSKAIPTNQSPETRFTFRSVRVWFLGPKGGCLKWGSTNIPHQRSLLKGSETSSQLCLFGFWKGSGPGCSWGYHLGLVFARFRGADNHGRVQSLTCDFQVPLAGLRERYTI